MAPRDVAARSFYTALFLLPGNEIRVDRRRRQTRRKRLVRNYWAYFNRRNRQSSGRRAEDRPEGADGAARRDGREPLDPARDAEQRSAGS